MPMDRRSFSLVGALAGGLIALALAAGSTMAATPYRVPHMPWGSPDLEGAWTAFARTPLERPDGVGSLTLPDADATALEEKLNRRIIHPADDPFGQGESEWYPDAHLARIDGLARTSWIVSPADGRVPYRPEARRLFNAGRARQTHGFDNPEDRPPQEQCLIGTRGVSGPPMLSALFPTNFRIVQTAQAVAILSEVNHDVRIVRLNASHLPAAIRPWMGDSIGRWEGQTLVVETTNFNPRDHFHVQFELSPNTRIVERFTRVSPTEIFYEFSVEDAGLYTSVWRGEIPLMASKDPVYEVACHEGNYSMAGVLAGARQDEAKAAVKAGAVGGPK